MPNWRRSAWFVESTQRPELLDRRLSEVVEGIPSLVSAQAESDVEGLPVTSCDP